MSVKFSTLPIVYLSSLDFWRSISKGRPQHIFCEFEIIVCNGFKYNLCFFALDNTSFQKKIFNNNCKFCRFTLFLCRLSTPLTGPNEKTLWKKAPR